MSHSFVQCKSTIFLIPPKVCMVWFHLHLAHMDHWWWLRFCWWCLPWGLRRSPSTWARSPNTMASAPAVSTNSSSCSRFWDQTLKTSEGLLCTHGAQTAWVDRAALWVKTLGWDFNRESKHLIFTIRQTSGGKFTNSICFATVSSSILDLDLMSSNLVFEGQIQLLAPFHFSLR